MKNLYLLFLLLFPFSMSAQLITTWKTDNAGVSCSTCIEIPIFTFSGSPNFNIDWENDGIIDVFGASDDITHDYGVAGTYEVAITGNLSHLFFANSTDKLKILSIEQWGGVTYDSMVRTFEGCANLVINATDNPDLSNVDDAGRMFIGANSLVGDLSGWDVSSITQMDEMFQNCNDFDSDLSGWDVSNVTNMRNMFLNANSFNSDLSGWDVSNVTTMDQMFRGCTLFNSDISGWDVGNVIVMTTMFLDAVSFNQDIGAWDVSSVTTMSSMFAGTDVFNQDIGAWDVSSVNTMFGMFSNADVFNQDIGGWDVSNVTNMGSMFRSAGAFNQDIGGWDVSNVTNMSRMFEQTQTFNQDIGGWDVSNVTNMSFMFSSADAFNQDIGGWDVSNVTNMLRMFILAQAFDQDIGGWNVSSVTNMDLMFQNCQAFDQDLGAWDVSNVTDMQNMFQLVTLSTANYDALLIGWDALNLQSGVQFHGGNSKYCAGEVARNNMITSDGWTIFDGGLDAGCGTTVPLCTALTDPFDGAIDVTILTNLMWSSVTDADGYRLSVGTSSGGIDIVNDLDLGNTTLYTPSSPLPCSTTIYVGIIPYNGNGDAMGCFEESFTTENVIADAGNDVSICPGSSTQLMGSGGFSYSWSPTTGLDDPNIFNPIATPSTTTMYTLTAMSSSGCVGTDDVLVSVNSIPTVNITGNLIICDGESTTLDAGTFSSYAWSTGETSQTITVNPTVMTSYSVTVSDANGCINSAQETVLVNLLPSVTANASNNPICQGGSSVISATGAGGMSPYSYSWDNGLGAGNSFTVQPTTTTTYTATITDNNGCINTDMITITVNASPSVNITGNMSICEGENTTLDAGSFASYSWNTGATSQTISITPIIDTDYFVTVTDANGCTNEDQVTVVVNTLPAPTITGSLVICEGDNTTLDAGNFSSYSWSTGETTQTISVAPTVDTDYTVTVTDSNGCTNSDLASVLVNDLPQLLTDATPSSICLGDMSTLQATGSGGQSPYSYTWDNGLGSGSTFNVIPAATTTYTVTITDDNGCTNIDMVTVMVNDLPVPEITGNLSICVSENTTLEVDNFSSYLWSTGATTQSITVSPLVDTDYFVTVTDANGCTNEDEATVVVNTLPTPTITGGLLICEGDNTTLDAGNFSSYSWSTGETTQTISVAPTVDTDYTVTVTDSNGCTNSDLASVLVNDLPQLLTNAIPSSICMGDMSTLQATGSGGQSPYSYTWDNGLGSGSTFNVTPAMTTTYTVTITDDNGCTNIDMVTVVVNDLPVPEITGNLNICASVSTTIEVDNFSSYLWSTGATTQSITVSPLVDTDYFVTVTDANGCTNEDEVTITVDPLPTPTITGNTVICEGEETILDAGNFSSYDWSNGATSQTIFVSPTTDTDYIVIVTDANGCTNSALATVAVDETPIVEADASPNNICEGETMTLSAEGFGGDDPYTFDWDNGLGTGNNFVLDPISTTTYSVTITDDNGCSSVDAVTVEVNEIPEPSITGNFTICNGEEAILDAGGGFDFYDWSNGETNQTIFVSPNSDTDYSVTVTDFNGCSNSDFVEVFVNSLPSPEIAGNLTVCSGESSILDAGDFDFYDWSTGETTQTIIVNPLVDTDYSVTVTDFNGCTDTDEVLVEINDLLATDIVVTSGIICAGGSTFMEASGFGGQAPYSFEWDNGLGNGSSFTVAPLVSTDYSVTMTDNNGCTNIETVTINVSPTPSINIAGAQNICEGESTVLDAGNFSSYMWSTGQTTQNITVNPSADTQYSVTVTDSNGCTNMENVTVAVNTIPSPSIAGSQMLCAGEVSTLDAGAFDSYLWSTGEITQMISINPSTNTEYTVTVTNGSGCDNSDVISVQVNQLPTVNIAGAGNICAGSSALLDAGTHASYMWSTGETTQSIVVGPASSASYAVTVSDNNGCSNSSLVSVFVNTVPSPSINGDINICLGENTTLDVGSYSAYNWSNGETTQNINVSPSMDTNYSVTVTDQNGCTGITSAMVTLNQVATPVIVGNTILCNNSSTILSLTETFSTYLWNTGSTESQITVSTPGTYQVTVINQDGCEGTTNVIVQDGSNNSITISQSAPLCSGSTITLSAQQGFASYEWETGETGNEIEVSESGIYVVNVVTNDGCPGTGQLEVTESLIEFAISTFNESCFGVCDGEIRLDIDPSYSVVWESGSTSFTEVGLCPGDFQVEIFNAEGCSTTQSINIEEGALVEATIEVDDLTLTGQGEGGEAPYTYTWSTGDTTQVIENQVGTFELVIADANGCEAVAQLIISSTIDEQLSKISFYPNPVNDIIYIESDQVKMEDISYSIYSSTGQFLETGNSLPNQINVQDYEEGMYLIQLASKKGSYTQRFIIMH